MGGGEALVDADYGSRICVGSNSLQYSLTFLKVSFKRGRVSTRRLSFGLSFGLDLDWFWFGFIGLLRSEKRRWLGVGV